MKDILSKKNRKSRILHLLKIVITGSFNKERLKDRVMQLTDTAIRNFSVMNNSKVL